MPWAVKLTTSARGWTSWKESPLLAVMGLHLARKRTKPATAIKFNTSRTLTLRKEAIKLPEGHLQPPRCQQALGERGGRCRPRRAHRSAPARLRHRHRAAGGCGAAAEAVPSPPRGYGRPGEAPPAPLRRNFMPGAGRPAAAPRLPPPAARCGAGGAWPWRPLAAPPAPSPLPHGSSRPLSRALPGRSRRLPAAARRGGERGAGGGRGAAPAPLSARSGERPRAGPGGEERWRGPCAPTPSKQPPPGLPRLAGMRRGCSESFRAGGVQAPPARLGVPASARLLGLCPTRMEAEPTAAFKHELQPVLPSPNVLHQAPRWSAPTSYAPRFVLL